MQKKTVLCVKQSGPLKDLEPYIMSYAVCFAAPFLKIDFLLRQKCRTFLERDPTLRITFLPRLWTEWNADTAPGKHKIRRKTPVPIYVFTQEQPRTYLQDLDTLIYCSLTTVSSSASPLLPPGSYCRDVK